MNLQEQINRIKSLITEDKFQEIKTLIDKNGVKETINSMGGYDNFYKHISFKGNFDEICVYLIKKLVLRFSELITPFERDGFDDGPGFNVADIGLNGFEFDEIEGEELKIIELFGVDYASVDHYFYEGYDDDGHPIHSDDMDMYTEDYDDYGDEIKIIRIYT
jgi:hypothetical protein